MTYEETIAFLYSQLPMYQRQGKAAYKADLNNTIELCRILGNPEKKIPSIHIAGTNGKGSVAHYIAAYLQLHGLKTGLYTSPHLVDFRERIRIDGKMIDKEDVVEFVQKFRKDVGRIRPSFFEWTFGLAMHHFHKEQVDIAVVETGMGGRLDSTNVVNSVLSVITNIGFDHTQFLGNTLQKIAGEKAGIIKSGVPVVIGERQKTVENVFLQKAIEKQAPICFADELEPPPKVNKEYAAPYDDKNIRTAWAALGVWEQIREYAPDKSLFKKAVEEVGNLTGLRGRWEILGESPLIIADTAHNAEGLSLTMSRLMQLPARNRHIVFGMVNDKDPEKVLSLLPLSARYYLCEPSVPRAMKVDRLEQIFREKSLKYQVLPDVKAAVEGAKKAAAPHDVIYIGGSTFVVADALA